MTTPELLKYELADSIATITMDDGKANVMSAAMLGALHALDELPDLSALRDATPR